MKVIAGKTDHHGKIQYFEIENIDAKKGKQAVVEMARGLILVELASDVLNKKGEYIEVSGKTIRVATPQDIKNHEKNEYDCVKAMDKCKELVDKYKLNMNVVSCSFTLDRKQLLFNFTSDERVDFRNLAKDLGGIYKTRIELRQIGARDKASIVGGVGPCGRMLCCSKFLYNFESVSINMAKNQNIALNPSKINGACGRLLCCLKYEDEDYKAARKEGCSGCKQEKETTVEGN